MKTMNNSGWMVRLGITAAAAVIVIMSAGCTSKNYVRSQTAPLVNKTNDLDTRTASDHRAIVDTDERAQQGIARAQSAADSADAHATAAQSSADQAQNNAQTAFNRVDSLAGVVANLDSYREVSHSSVTFGFDKSVLTAEDKKELDALAVGLQSSRHYLVQLTGGTDSSGDAQYNYALSQRRADAVANYLQVRYNIPPRKFYLVGIGKDDAPASNRTASGRRENRRVEVKVLSNMQEDNTTATTQPPTHS